MAVISIPRISDDNIIERLMTLAEACEPYSNNHGSVWAGKSRKPFASLNASSYGF